jgi:hypothetical protein
METHKIIISDTMLNGNVMMRSYDRKECVKKKLGAIIKHKGKKMTLSAQQVRVKITSKSFKKFKTQYEGKAQDYYLYYYKWNPDINQGYPEINQN